MAVPANKASNGTSFVTIATCDGRAVFQISRLAELFIETLLRLRTRGHYKLHAFVVMPDRVHLLITPQLKSLDQTIEHIQNAFGAFDGHLHPADSIWEAGFVTHPIRNMRSLETLRTYLHQAPVRAHLSNTPELYPYSSAYRLAKKISPFPTTTLILESAS
jgi:putative transposase